MKIVIDERDLNLVLEEKKNVIGAKITWDSIVSAISLTISALIGGYGNFFFIPGWVFRYILLVMGISFTIKCVRDTRNFVKHPYTHKDLLRDIESKKENTHDHSIVAIKDTFNEYPNRFLLYYDTRWKCWLFPNFKDNADNEGFIKEGISNKLKVKAEGIDMMFLTRRRQQKYSESHKEERIYLHSVYKATIKKFPSQERKDEFEVDGVRFKWMGIPEMEKDDRIQKVNTDVVQLVKECCN